ncbi:MAG: CARDB domain-containing protein, partial [Candidatus Thermoplasmatota archaeon]|nr:CARDB domain-containing protein [Candidatus Thermoplasmatota archaeon]
ANVSSTVIAKKGGTGDNGLSIFLPPKSWGGGTAGYRYASLFLAMYDTYLKDKHNEVAIDFGHSELSNIQWAPFLRANLAPSAYTHDFTIQVHWGWGLGSWRNTIRAPWYARVNSTTYVDAFIRNWGKVSETNVPVKLYFQGSAVETKYISLGQKEVAYLSFNWTTPSQPGSYQVRIQAELAGDEKPANDGANVTIKVTDKKVFVVDDDGGASYEKYYTDALNASGIGYEYWNVKQTEGTINELWDRTAYGTPSHADTLKAFDVVIWFTGNYDVRFKGRDIRAQEAYLEQGGSLFVADANLEDMQWCTYYYRDKLHTEYVNDSSGVTTLTGVANDPIGDGLSLTISTGDAVAQAEPSVIEPRNTSVANWTKASAQRVFIWSTGT